MEGRRVTQGEYSRRLPPPEAWKRPSRWIDFSTGLSRTDTSKLVLPTDDRGFVKPDEAIDYVLDYFFWPDYDWPYSNDDPETALDRHHFQHRAAAYEPENFEGSLIPSKFREIPTRIGLMPRQLHNVLHDFTAEPVIPKLDAMAEYHQNYMLAYQAFSKLINSAKNVTSASRMFSQRAQAINSGHVSPRDKTDRVAQEMMRDFFVRHFEQYGRAVLEVMRFEGGDFIASVPDKSLFDKPHLVVKKMGKIVTQNHVNFVPHLRAT